MKNCIQKFIAFSSSAGRYTSIFIVDDIKWIPVWLSECNQHTIITFIASILIVFLLLVKCWPHALPRILSVVTYVVATHNIYSLALIVQTLSGNIAQLSWARKCDPAKYWLANQNQWVAESMSCTITWMFWKLTLKAGD